eukprot:997633-Prymnesium_polylepis.1
MLGGGGGGAAADAVCGRDAPGDQLDADHPADVGGGAAGGDRRGARQGRGHVQCAAAKAHTHARTLRLQPLTHTSGRAPPRMPRVGRGLCAACSRVAANFTLWLDDVSAKQEAKPLHEPPAFLSHQVTSKLEPIEKE